MTRSIAASRRPSGRAIAASIALAGAFAAFVPTAAHAEEAFEPGMPSIVGDVVVGSTVTADAGTWTPEPELTYSWSVDGLEVGTDMAYTLQAGDGGASLVLDVTAHLDGYSDLTVSTEPVTVALATQEEFTTAITGRWVVGETVSAAVPAGDGVTVQWLRDGTAFSGGTAADYVLRRADAGHLMSVVVTRSIPGYVDAVATATGARTVLNAFGSAPVPTIAGPVRAGSTLTAVTDGLRPADAKVAYQWFRDGVALTGRTSATLPLKNIDQGKRFSVVVTYSKRGYAAVTQSSAQTKAAAARPKVASANGYYRVGKDIQPGTYFRTGAKMCEWYRLSGKDKNKQKYVLGNNGGWNRVYIQVKATDTWVHFRGCGGWTKFDGTGAKRSVMGQDGTYAVGTDIRPGTYTAEDITGIDIDGFHLHWCLYVSETRPLGSESSLQDMGVYQSGPVTVKAKAGEFLQVMGCGRLTRVS
ncbi:hypothetical protein [Demequina phytophila]|uniref:hypothetical protein n=1 Tax=Demequina phytophila TaxID=1638981 RepID=UPI0007855DA7|nr:hypothetical protein [Demequina phytophila]